MHVTVRHNPNVSKSLGARMHVDLRGRIIVNSVAVGSLAHDSGLAAGAVLIAIDGESVREMAAADVLPMLGQASLAAPAHGEGGRKVTLSRTTTRKLKFALYNLNHDAAPSAAPSAHA